MMAHIEWAMGKIDMKIQEVSGEKCNVIHPPKNQKVPMELQESLVYIYK